MDKKVQCKAELISEKLPQNYIVTKKNIVKLNFKLDIKTLDGINHIDVTVALRIYDKNKKMIGELISLTKCQIENNLASMNTAILSVKSAITACQTYFNHYKKTKNIAMDFPIIPSDEIIRQNLVAMKIRLN